MRHVCASVCDLAEAAQNQRDCGEPIWWQGHVPCLSAGKFPLLRFTGLNGEGSPIQDPSKIHTGSIHAGQGSGKSPKAETESVSSEDIGLDLGMVV